jgi:hypothetical protein
MAGSVFSIATSEFQAEGIVNELQVAGFFTQDISVLLPDKARLARQVKTPISGASGGTLGWLAGIRAISIPGAGPFIASGPILTALSGSAVGGSSWGIAGALAGMGLSRRNAEEFEQKVRSGQILVAVHSENAKGANHAKAIFEQAGTAVVVTTIENELGAIPPETRDEKWEQW